ncbi:MAG: LysM domain-containing protein [Desulfobacteraceae bacterium]|nr:MAG: LysM domain-containing protein [Desulfobacteraceae bacterium]
MFILPMHSPHEDQTRLRFPALVLLFAFLYCLGAPAAAGSRLIYKNYIVRYDRGWDILCEPYVVEKGDWVLKIFRQKGEIAHKDFREFLGIFQRLNPHVQDIDMVRPGQTIYIPLRKLEQGSLPGQASGLVSIPFVSLAKVIDVLHQNTQRYQVQRGDTISQLIAARFGRYGSQDYREGVKLLQAANPQITDLDHIYAGQTLYLPDPAIREKEWYDALYDEKGALRETIHMGRPAPAGPEKADAGTRLPPPPSEQPQEPEMQATALTAAAAAVGGKLMNKGTYFAPQPGKEDFEIDLSLHPLLDMQTGAVLFTRDGKIMNRPPEQVQPLLPAVKIAAYDGSASAEQMVAAIFQALNGEPVDAEEAGFEDQGVLFTVRAKWSRIDTDQRRLCITPISDPGEQTPESLRRYLEQHGIVLRELLPGGSIAPPRSERGAGRHAVKDILALTFSDHKELVQRVARALGFSHAPGVSVMFPYGGVQLQAYAELIATADGHEVLVDFGDLHGDTLTAIRQSGQNIVQIAAEDSPAAVVQTIIGGLGVPCTENPSFLAASRPAQYNTLITVQGVLYNGPQNKRTLLSGAALPPAVTDVLSAGGIAVVTWHQ